MKRRFVRVGALGFLVSSFASEPSLASSITGDINRRLLRPRASLREETFPFPVLGLLHLLARLLRVLDMLPQSRLAGHTQAPREGTGGRALGLSKAKAGGDGEGEKGEGDRADQRVVLERWVLQHVGELDKGAAKGE